MNIAVPIILFILVIVQLVNTIVGNSYISDVPKKHISSAREEDAKDRLHFQPIKRKKLLAKKQGQTINFHKSSFERKTEKLHKLANLAFQKLENDERNGYLSKLKPSPVRSQHKIRSKHLRKETKMKNRKHSKKDNKLFRKHTSKIHRMRDKILQLLEHNEKKYYISKINELSHQLD